MVEIIREKREEEQEMRAIFAQVMEELAAADSRVVYLDCDLVNSIGMKGYMARFPQQAVNCGIQEANMVGVAAGMSATGLIPFLHTFGPFATRRVMDQVFVSAAYAKLNVRIVGSDPGVTAALNGGTHMPFEDLGMMRCVPGVTILEPTDSVMLQSLLRQSKEKYGVFYIRLSRKKARAIYTLDTKFQIGKALTLREGSDVSIFASGICVGEALDAADLLAKEGIQARVIDSFTVKPLDWETVVAAAQETGAIVTAENHNKINGLGSAVAEVLGEHCPVPLERVGVADEFGEVGSVSYLMERFGLTAQHIAAAARKAVERKMGQQNR